MSDPLAVDIEERDKKRVDEEKRAREKELDDIRSVLKTAEGRRVYHRFMARCHTFHMSFTQGMPDQTAFMEGERSIGNFMLFELLDADPDKYVQMMREFKSEMVKKEIIRKQGE